MGTTSHSSGCDCQRCRGFDAGNAVSATHGAYVAAARLGPRQQELADLIRPHLPIRSEAFEATLLSWATVLTRIEISTEALETFEEEAQAKGARLGVSFYTGAPGEALGRLRADLRSWLTLSLRYAEALGCTPSAQAKLLRDAGLGRAAAATASLREHLERTHGREVGS
jgi:hypothetical protein